jgi:hypothetical protein
MRRSQLCILITQGGSENADEIFDSLVKFLELVSIPRKYFQDLEYVLPAFALVREAFHLCLFFTVAGTKLNFLERTLEKTLKIDAIYHCPPKEDAPLRSKTRVPFNANFDQPAQDLLRNSNKQLSYESKIAP